jgi:hypothetical protein
MDSRFRNSWQRWLRLGLLSLLLALQGQLLAHEIDHLGDGERGACVLCAHGPGQDALPFVAPNCIAESPSHAWRDGQDVDLRALRPPRTLEARAPPHD